MQHAHSQTNNSEICTFTNQQFRNSSVRRIILHTGLKANTVTIIIHFAVCTRLRQFVTTEFYVLDHLELAQCQTTSTTVIKVNFMPLVSYSAHAYFLKI